MRLDPRAGKLPATATLVDVPRLMTAYYTDAPMYRGPLSASPSPVGAPGFGARRLLQ